jgi:hypothetical protein
MKRALTISLLWMLGALALSAPAAQASFGLVNPDVTFTSENGSSAMQAGSHPFQMSISFDVNTVGKFPDESPKDVFAELPPGFIGNTTATPHCSAADFATIETLNDRTACGDSTAIGLAAIRITISPGNAPVEYIVPVFNLAPPPGKAVKLGFLVANVPVVIEGGLSESPPYNIRSGAANIPQAVSFYGSNLILWGTPGGPAHDPYRGHCDNSREVAQVPGQPDSLGECPTSIGQVPFITLPASCQGPLKTVFEGDSWQNPGPPYSYRGVATTHDASTPPQPLGTTGCSKVGFAPTIESKATTTSAETGSGLDFDVDFDDPGMTNPEGIAQSQVKKAEVLLPEGMTINPSVAEGLGVCTPAQVARETAFSLPGEGCPEASKIGTLHVDSPLVEQPIDGSVYLAQEDDPTTSEPGAENPFDSLIALYFVLQNRELGVSVRLPVKVEPDPKTGRLVATLEDNPQIPFTHFEAHLRTGDRSALITPSACGTYATTAVLTPWSDPGNPLTTTSQLKVTSGIRGGPCPPGGIPPFNPDFQAGAINNNAGSFSPFDMRLIREDGEQDMTKFSAVLPPGELGSLNGVSKCPDSAIGAAKAKTGRQEIASPSCPANSLIGHTLAGAGVGSALTYVKGYVYLGGPYHGDPLSVIAITPAVAGPFDAGTVVVQEALTLNPKTAEVEVDGARSDPIPHIVKGIVLKLRDLRIYVDRQNFTLNPTSCDESKARSVLFGSYLNVLDPSDDRPVDLSARYQAANCLNLGFKPKLALNLKGGTERGGHPALKAIYTPRKGDANIKGLVVRLPHSAFLDQAHIRTICTRVQFAAGAGNGEQCPKGARYGFIRAWTPLLEEPLEGPVFLRSSNHKLPDLLFALHGLVNIEVDVRIDSSHGGIRATLDDAPDATLSKVVLHMQGAKKGLIINSKNLCGSKNRANVLSTGHNGKQFHTHPLMKAQCGKARHTKHQRHRR